MNAEEIARALGAKRQGPGWRARCPAHDAHDPSLAIAQGINGAALVICRAGCSQDAVLAALKAKGLWHDHGDTIRHPELGEPDAVFEYFDPEGRLLGAVCRWNRGGDKEIRPVIREAGRWRWAAFPKPRPLYRLPDIAAHTDKPVLVVEGEKAADAARELIGSHVVTCWPGGTGAVAHVDLAPLKGRDVVLWPDADEAGRKAMRAIADRLTAARSVRGVKLPDGLPQGWDLADSIPADLDPVALIGQARNLVADRLAGLGLVTAADLVLRDFKPPVWAVPDVVPEGLGIFAGRPKVGKSWGALDMSIAVASGTVALGNIQCEPGDVLLLALEDTERRLHGRLKAVLQGEPAPARLDIATAWRRPDEGGLDDLRAWLVAHPQARLVVVDTLQKIRGARKRDAGVYEDDYAAVAAFKMLADEFNVPILLVHHLRKEGASDPIEAVSGTAGITGSADTILVLKREPNDGHGFLYVRGRDIQECELALEFDDDTGRWLSLGSGREFRMSEERRAVLAVLREAGTGLTPTAIAKELGKKQGSVRRLLHGLRQDGDVSRLPNGQYYVVR